MEREATTKVVTSVCGADFVQFLAALAVLPRSIWKNMMNSTVSSNPAEANLPNFFIISSFFVINSCWYSGQFGAEGRRLESW